MILFQATMTLMNPVLLLCRRPITTGENYLQYLMIPMCGRLDDFAV
jgi:hypothetical protein